jgi:cyclic pyranopterin monophosphate synthase
MGDFSHLNKSGDAAMVDVSDKTSTSRTAFVEGNVLVSSTCIEKLNKESISEIITTARISGIQAAKKTSELIPLCHQINLSKVDLDISLNSEEKRFSITAMAKTNSQTGVEMEAFTCANIAALTIYDMIKAVNPEAKLDGFKLVEKLGGKNGHWKRSQLN